MSLTRIVEALKGRKEMRIGDIEVKKYIPKEKEFIASVGWRPKVHLLIQFGLKQREELAVKLLDEAIGKERFSYQNFIQWLFYIPFEGRHNTPLARLSCRMYSRTENNPPYCEIDLDSVLPVPKPLDEKMEKLFRAIDVKVG